MLPYCCHRNIMLIWVMFVTIFGMCGNELTFVALLLSQELQSSNTMLSMGHVVTTSVGMCDIDIRPVSFIKFMFSFPQLVRAVLLILVG